MDNKPTITIFEELIEKTRDYIDTRLELYRLKSIDKISSLASFIVTGIIILIFFFLFFVFANIGLALMIGHWIGNNFAGFFILAGVYALAGLVIFLRRKRLFKNPITNSIIKWFT